MILFWLIVLFIAVPLTELMLLIWVGGEIGTLATIGIVVFTGILGASLARSEGLATWQRFQTRLATGKLPHEDLVDGLLILIAGAVLLTPGFLTDVAGFLLLVPAARAVVRRSITRRLMRRVVVATTGPRPAASYEDARESDNIVDAEYTVDDVRPASDTQEDGR
jgi:UPF0716 protein FxsA